MRRFAYRLAVRLGQPNVDVMLRGMTARHLVEWMVFDGLEPFGPQRADLRTAALISEMRNLEVLRRPRKKLAAKPKLTTAADCAILFGDDAERERKAERKADAKEASRRKRDWRDMKMQALTFIATLPLTPED